MHKGFRHENISNTSFTIPQYDGLNLSLNDSMTSHFSVITNSSSYSPYELSWFSQDEPSTLAEDLTNQPIPVHISHRNDEYLLQSKSLNDRRPYNNITIRRDNRMIEAVSLPTFSVYNMRSIWSKLTSLAEDMDERQTDLTILSEVWEKKENSKHGLKRIQI